VPGVVQAASQPESSICDSAVVTAPRLKVLAVLGSAVALAGCGSSGSKIPSSKLPKLVLQQADLPRAFSAFYVGRQLSVDQSGARTDPTRFGRTGGWIGRYHRSGSTKTKGPFVVSSRADLFKDAGGAKQDLELYRAQLAGLAGAKDIDVAKLGEQAFGITTLQKGAVRVRSYAIAWRQANATAELELNGFAGKLTLADALALARTQETRLRDWAG
jgi:hypothetical protein